MKTVLLTFDLEQIVLSRTMPHLKRQNPHFDAKEMSQKAYEKSERDYEVDNWKLQEQEA